MENEILNFSKVEEDPFGEIPLTLGNKNETIHDFYERLPPTTFEIVANYALSVFALGKFFLAIGTVIADLLLIYLILRYKRLKKSYNLYIVHYCIMNLGYYLIAPMLLLIHLLFMSGFGYLMFIYCYIGMTEVTLLYMSFIFAICLSFEWAINTFKQHLIKNLNNIFKRRFFILYGILGLFLTINCLSCEFGYETASFLALSSMPMMLVTLIYIHYLRRKTILTSEQLKTEYVLWVSTIAVGIYAPIYLIDLYYRFNDDFILNGYAYFIFIIEYLLSFLSTPGPIVILIYLNRTNKHFKMAYDTTFNKTVRNYGADNLDDASDNEEIVENGQDKNVQQNINDTNQPRNIILVP